MFASEEDQAKAINEYASFSLKMGAFEDPRSVGARFDDDPKMWGEIMVLVHLCFKNWHLNFLDNQHLPLVLKEIGVHIPLFIHLEGIS